MIWVWIVTIPLLAKLYNILITKPCLIIFQKILKTDRQTNQLTKAVIKTPLWSEYRFRQVESIIHINTITKPHFFYFSKIFEDRPTDITSYKDTSRRLKIKQFVSINSDHSVKYFLVLNYFDADVKQSLENRVETEWRRTFFIYFQTLEVR